MNSLWSSTWNATVPPSTSSTSDPQASSALDFLAVLAKTNLRIYRSSQLGLRDSHYIRLGRGGYAVVERGGRNIREYVAVKMCRLPATATVQDTQNAIDRQLNELGLEMRILSHAPIRIHPNIVDIVGICMDDDFGYSSLSLVLEYSEHGNLREFLLASGTTLSEHILISLIAQVAQGLAALHRQLICHGDVKLENCLVFGVGECWTVKLSDFGGSIVGTMDTLSTSVECCFGTRLLNAPEIRSSATRSSFTISDAMSTDVFSFGLLTWEILKHGHRYFEDEWISGSQVEHSEDLMQYVIENMPDNGLLIKSMEFLEKKVDNPEISLPVRQIFELTLQDMPQARASIQTLCAILRSSLDAKAHEECDKYQPLCVWNRQSTFFEIYSEIRDDCTTISHLPFDTQIRIVDGMKALATSEIVPATDRSHAAICVAECYLLGFGVAHDKSMTVNWIFQSALLGSRKAQVWYHRMAPIGQIEPKSSAYLDKYLKIEDELAEYQPHEYLSNRIRLQLRSIMMEIKSAMVSSEVPLSIPSLFECDAYDKFLPLHCAAFVGDDLEVRRQFDVRSSESQCERGFTAIHYACLGGHLSTLQLLVELGSSLHKVGKYGVNPLHTCLGFSPADAASAVSVLLENGAVANSKVVMPFTWDYHDLVLNGTPLEWAVRSGNRHLVQILLPVYSDFESLDAAISQFFCDIAADIIRHFNKAGLLVQNRMYITQLQSSFGLSIAHGANISFAMRATMQVCQKYGVLATESDNHTTFKALIGSACAEYDFQLIEICLDLMPSQHIKRVEGDGSTALSHAIIGSKNHGVWKSILEKIIWLYTVDELECDIGFGNSYLHLAVLHGSVIAARILLELGVDVNQRTYDEHEETPLHICMRAMHIKEMFALLMSYGANLNAISSLSRTTPLEERLFGKQSSVDFVASLLENNNADIEFMPILHGIVEVSLSATATTNSRLYSQDALRMLLRSPRISSFIDEPDEHGLTLLHKAVQYLHTDTVSLLLEAGASADIPYRREPSALSLLPLQFATNLGHMYWLHSINDGFPQLRLRKASAMAVAFKLLQWHHARNDTYFRGITKLHLACRMNIPDEVKLSVAAGDSPLAQGKWPGLEGKVTPSDMLHGNFLDEDAILETMFSGSGYINEELKQSLKHSVTFEPQTALAARTETHEILRGTFEP